MDDWADDKRAEFEKMLREVPGAVFADDTHTRIGNFDACITLPGLSLDQLRTHQLDEIEAELLADFPSRSAVLRESFDAHRHRKYSLSILGFLTQADGIWHDLRARHLFYGGTVEAIEELAADIPEANVSELVLALTSERWPLRLSHGQRGDEFADLNRHQVLHGEVADYGTEQNSLKAIAFLNYCAFMLSEAANADAESAN